MNKQGLIVCDPAMLEIYRNAYQLSGKPANILILGESGTGKDCLAKFIHQAGNRAKRPFLHINCSAIPSDLFESELFGYESGMFTGALYAGKKGLLESADRGTIFLDEIGELALFNQVKLLQFFQEKTITKLGGSSVKHLDIRIICATNVCLKQAIQNGAFREDLYYRIRVLEFTLPPLRERPEDLSAFIALFQKKIAQKPCEHKIFTKDALEFLQDRYWAGNIRELQNFVERLYVLENEKEITRSMIEGHYYFSTPKSEKTIKPQQKKTLSLKAAIANFEKEYIAEAIKKSDSLDSTAKMLGIDLSTLNRKKQQYGIYKKWHK